MGKQRRRTRSETKNEDLEDKSVIQHNPKKQSSFKKFNDAKRMKLISSLSQSDNSSPIKSKDKERIKKKILQSEEIVLVEDFLKKRKRKDKKLQIKSKIKNGKVSSYSPRAVEKDENHSNSEISEEKDDSIIHEISKIEPKRAKQDVIYLESFMEEYHGVLFLQKNQVVALKGYAHVIVIHGSIEVNGYHINKLDTVKQGLDIYSPTSSSLLYLKDNSQADTKPIVKESLQTSLEDLGIVTADFKRLPSIGKIFSCVILKKIRSHLPSILKKFNKFVALPEKLELLGEPFNEVVLKVEKWTEVTNDLQKDMSCKQQKCICSVLLCGGKDVGKSSFSRFLINKLLNRHGVVFYLECDCGQTEFTPPGILSLVKITKPLFGLPFTHQLKPVKSFFYGHITSAETPSEYICLINMLFDHYHTEHRHEGPLVVNQQGWVRGLGLSLLIDCIRIISPCNIIQMNSPIESRNLVVTDLNDEAIQSHKGWVTQTLHQSIKEAVHSCTYFKLHAVVNDKLVGQNKSLASRNLVITSYLSGLYKQSFDTHLHQKEKQNMIWLPPNLSTIRPYVIHWKELAVHVMHQKITFDLILHTLNMSVVCLARVSEDLIVRSDDPESTNPLQLKDQSRGEFLGLGIIRNIDPKNHLFYILTPEPIETLCNVNALLKGNIQLPSSFLYEDPKSEHPYFDHDYITVGSKMTSGKKPRFNLKRKPSRLRNSFGEKG